MDSFGIGEGDKFFYIFTKELGLVNATAKSVRELKSKNRFGLQDFSVSIISLVRGKDIWRITNVAAEENLFFSFEKDKDKFNSIVKIFSLLRQLIHGEEKNEELFNLVEKAIDFLKATNLGLEELKNFELVTDMRILNNLGYFDEGSEKDLFFRFLESDEFSEDLVSKMVFVRKEVQKSIDSALLESHL